jgi:hypothetical protein
LIESKIELVLRRRKDLKLDKVARNSVADSSRRTAWRRRRVTRGRFFVGRCVGRHHCISGMMDQVEDLRKAEII